ncbi:hypothetical protein LNKW23_15440 [Paralimibaculum aggregatum]|uniref:Sugar transporter n=1 Tax=Paralimibaculum aggregatum TaxID=3036245 RepID=A0ABQ6LIT4_9RHOB|nr:hypothetical protein LNKW23_15440 [Limibaculum sp. NKW23]
MGACGVVYTVPDVGGNAVDSGTEYNVRVVPLSHETAAAANLDTYVPPRLPLAFQPDAVARVAAKGPPPPQLPALPAPSAPLESRPSFIPDRFPPLGTPQPYRIGVSDVVLLSVTSAATSVEALPGLLTAQAKRNGYVVQDDGAIAVPDAGRIRIAGLTMPEAEAAIFDALVAAGIDPTFSLEIAEFNSQRVAIGGEVRAPTLAPISLTPLYLHEAVELAGGLAVTDRSVAKVQLTRRGTTYQIGIERFREDPAARRIVLQDGDSIFVGSEFREDAAQLRFDQELALRSQRITTTEFALRLEELKATRESQARDRLRDAREVFEARLELGAVARDYAYVTGEVGSTKRFPLPFERSATLADVLFDDQRLSIQNSDFSAIYVLRPASDPTTPGALTAYHLDADNAVNLALATQLQMRPNDVVFVAEQPITSWNRAISQALPNLFITAASIATGN